ncbi:hypothetical protein [Oxynema aestuarii]|uniref:Uncharacterized protein n=1 Tax=Oxynema aestuarii AP17 TaxID=2064643 RepID=A0A6H1TVQ6_9CYAN|nr:hypothetical protein [Oxynema aestuarii]QIZ70651.1 hypothetical protein HCG48_08720 [Oxynema aestuarii AP17]RMH76229.1 MAG: hypothetical protein D6680_09135 [Cyanobacteria bacterium J007]
MRTIRRSLAKSRTWGRLADRGGANGGKNGVDVKFYNIDRLAGADEIGLDAIARAVKQIVFKAIGAKVLI